MTYNVNDAGIDSYCLYRLGLQLSTTAQVHIIIGPEVQPLDPVRNLVPRRQDQHRGVNPPVAQRFQKAQPVAIRQLQVKQDDVKRGWHVPRFPHRRLYRTIPPDAGRRPGVPPGGLPALPRLQSAECASSGDTLQCFLWARYENGSDSR
jgi:hypothetical protein